MLLVLCYSTAAGLALLLTEGSEGRRRQWQRIRRRPVVRLLEGMVYGLVIALSLAVPAAALVWIGLNVWLALLVVLGLFVWWCASMGRERDRREAEGRGF